MSAIQPQFDTQIKSDSDLHFTRRRRGRALEHQNIDNEILSQKLSSTIVNKSFASLAKPTCLTASLAEQPKTVDGVPIVVEACLRYFSTRASNCEGLFRVPGNQRLVDQLWAHMKNHPRARLSANSISLFMLNHPEFTAYEVASFLKRFIGSTTNGPVVTYACYDPFLELVKQKFPAHLIGAKFKCIVGQLLVPDHRALLGRLCNFLEEFLEHEEQTLMNARALAVCFGFLIRAPPEISRARNCMGKSRARTLRQMNAEQRMQHMMAQVKISKLNALIIEAIIRNAQQIF